VGNNVSIRTTAPGAKEAAGQVKSLSDAYEKLAGGSAKAKLAGAAVAGGFALATKGALEMEDAQKTFIQTTGKSGEAAVAFSKDMNSIVGTSKTVGMGFDEIVETGANVENQFNTTGDATRQLTEDVVGFAKVTGQDASDAAGQLEDALSAFGLGAEDAAGMMDVLVASSQTFGTDVGPETLDQLKKMAPALQAMGIGAEDAVGFLNLFEGAGLDAAGAMKGFNAAITNIPPGENLKSVLEKVQAIEDPLLRAKYASEIFGAKAGAGLANALKPGGVALEDYILTTEEAVGAVDQTADDMLTSTDKIKMFGEKVGSVFRDAGQTFGPFITGLASVGTLMSPALSAAWGAVSNSPAVKAAATAAGIQSGSIFAAAAAFAIPLAALTGTPMPLWLAVPLVAAVCAHTALAFTNPRLRFRRFSAAVACGLVLIALAIEIPWFIDFETQYKDQGFAVLGVAMDEEGWDIVKPYVQQKKINYRVLMGTDPVAQLYGGVENLPVTTTQVKAYVCPSDTKTQSSLFSGITFHNYVGNHGNTTLNRKTPFGVRTLSPRVKTDLAAGNSRSSNCWSLAESVCQGLPAKISSDPSPVSTALTDARA
jgi:hypothetical protein